jgi:hypothetical protein
MSGRILPYLLARPIMGAAMGVVAYAGVAGGFLIATSSEPKTFSPEGILFFSVLAGLFCEDVPLAPRHRLQNAARRAARLTSRRGQVSGKGRRDSARSACAVTHSGVVLYRTL